MKGGGGENNALEMRRRRKKECSNYRHPLSWKTIEKKFNQEENFNVPTINGAALSRSGQLRRPKLSRHDDDLFRRKESRGE